MKDYKELVKGRIVTGATSQPVRGAEVKVYDKDLLVDDHLGSTTTDGEGRFAVEFRWSDYKDNRFEDRPDIFLKVKNPATGKTTKTKVYEELTGELAQDDSVEVMDLGDIPVD
jgi:hypothetical protein